MQCAHTRERNRSSYGTMDESWTELTTSRICGRYTFSAQSLFLPMRQLPFPSPSTHFKQMRACSAAQYSCSVAMIQSLIQSGCLENRVLSPRILQLKAKRNRDPHLHRAIIHDGR